MWRRLLIAWACIAALVFAAGTASAASSAPAKPHQGTSEFSAALHVCALSLATLEVHSGNAPVATTGTSDVPDAGGGERRLRRRWLTTLLARSASTGWEDVRAVAASTLISKGKGHFDKASGKRIDTPHVHEAKTHTGPSGRSSLGPKTTRPATKSDIRTARELAKREGLID